MNRILASLALLLAACGGSGVTSAGPDDVPGADLPPIEGVVFPDSHEAGGEDPGTQNDVPTEAACVPDCDNGGDRRCAGVQGAYQVCVEAGGCLRWSAPAFCDDGKACLDGECLAVCKTDPGCAAAGDRRCSAAAAFQECVEVAPGCVKLGEEKPCPGAAVCVGDGQCECQHACEAGDRRCFAASPDLYRGCREDEAGCRVWGEPTTCGADAVCEGAGVCEEVCTPDCDAKGAVECASGTSYRICMEVQPGCLRWGKPVACPGSLTCDGGECRVGCTSDPECDAAGKVGCADDGHERACEEVAPGCLKWGAAIACPLHQGCGAGGCACADGCAAEAAECIPDVDPHFRKVCDADDAGCLYWAYEDCGGGSVCEGGACVTLCGSDPGCAAEGVTRCESLDSYSTCAAVEGDADCIQFGPPAPCAEHRECVEATGTCACRVEAGCTAPDAKRCIDYDNAATCREDGGCLYWGPAEPCPEGNTCSGGVCGPLCVSDLDCPGIGAKRCADDGRQQECVEVPGQPGCNKWAPTQACPPHQACAEGTGCVCDNTCKTGESRCVGRSHYQSCSAPDAASCTFWSAPEPCPGGESCVKGACRLVFSPVVECGSITP
ncbi:MAG: hypothetical protein FJ087_23055, partial [Deltaproteobacteria bacterium]|nr:hypothetical protein [Deltaproteobacteria bacterium]